ncbi:MAG: NTPase [Bacteroidales bacterium]|nr:NTPase [Bacteroidales bacterium]
MINMCEEKHLQFISNLPCGEDYTEGKSQERLAVAIAEHIISTDSKNEDQIPRIIGLKGEWGTGKSNVIKILDKPNEELQKAHNVLKQIKDGYHIFEYDAWGHQEDLQRRSFLETLTNDLILKKILVGETTIETKKGEQKIVSWEEKLKYLLATKREFETETRPKLNDCFILTVLVAIFTPIFAIIANVDPISAIWWLSILITIFPLLVASIILLIIKRKHKWSIKDICREIVSIYSGQIQNNVSYETVSEDEPSVTDFKKWMEDISNRIGEPNKKLIVVYDNMDRLPADKVKELWSSIHTFFAENGFKNIWVIIPFDEKHLSCAFGESEEKEQLTKHFISKTFPVVYRVTPPVITDYKELFDNLYSQAFGETEEKDKETIYRILRLEKPDATIREMIEFINSLVALKQIWKGEIDLLYCAVFKLKENQILSDAVSQILSGDYLGDNLKNIIPNDEVLQTNIAALVYGVPKELAEQIPMIKYIGSCFDEKANDINKYSQSPKFINILTKVIQDADDAKTDNIIDALSKLDTQSFNERKNVAIGKLWYILKERKENRILSQQKFDDSYRSLLLHLDDRRKNDLVSKFCKRLQCIEKERKDGGHVEFNGKMYYEALSTIRGIIIENNFEIDITKFIEEVTKSPKVFIEYVLAAKEDYKLYKLKVDNKKLNDHLIDIIKQSKADNLNALSIIGYISKDSPYEFAELEHFIKTFIPTAGLTNVNFLPIFGAYKLLSESRPLEVQLTYEQRSRIWHDFSRNVEASFGGNKYLDIVAIKLANIEEIKNNQGVQIEFSDEQIEYIANQMDYYGKYGDLLVNSNNQNLNRVLKYMTENKLGYILSLDKVLPQFYNIKSKINITEEILLTQLDDWSDQKKVITKDNIHSIVPKDLYQFTKETTNDLTKHINETAIKALSLVDGNTLYNQINNPQNTNNYWYKVVENLIDTDFCNPLPENIFNIGIRYLKEVASNGIIPQEKSVSARIIERLDRQKTPAFIKDIRDTFCDGSQNRISANVFLYFANLFEEQGDLLSRADRVVHKIVEPIVDDIKCLQHIVNKPDYYSGLIKKAGNDASATIEKIEKRIKSGNADEKVLEFGKLIGITKENKDKQ